MGFLNDMKNKIKGKEKQEELNLQLNKEEKLIQLFKDQDKLPVQFVLDETGIKNEHALRTYLVILRKKKIFLKQKFGYVEKRK